MKKELRGVFTLRAVPFRTPISFSLPNDSAYECVVFPPEVLLHEHDPEQQVVLFAREKKDHPGQVRLLRLSSGRAHTPRHPPRGNSKAVESGTYPPNNARGLPTLAPGRILDLRVTFQYVGEGNPSGHLLVFVRPLDDAGAQTSLVGVSGDIKVLSGGSPVFDQPTNVMLEGTRNGQDLEGTVILRVLGETKSPRGYCRIVTAFLPRNPEHPPDKLAELLWKASRAESPLDIPDVVDFVFHDIWVGTAVRQLTEHSSVPQKNEVLQRLDTFLQEFFRDLGETDSCKWHRRGDEKRIAELLEVLSAELPAIINEHLTERTSAAPGGQQGDELERQRLNNLLTNTMDELRRLQKAYAAAAAGDSSSVQTLSSLKKVDVRRSLSNLRESVGAFFSRGRTATNETGGSRV